MLCLWLHKVNVGNVHPTCYTHTIHIIITHTHKHTTCLTFAITHTYIQCIYTHAHNTHTHTLTLFSFTASYAFSAAVLVSVSLLTSFLSFVHSTFSTVSTTSLALFFFFFLVIHNGRYLLARIFKGRHIWSYWYLNSYTYFFKPSLATPFSFNDPLTHSEYASPISRLMCSN